MNESGEPLYNTIVIGAGPAGLTASTLLSAQSKSVIVLESHARDVGGISRTVEYKGFRFDIGGHRFYSKIKEVEDFWSRLLGADLLKRARFSRIYYRGRFFSYPLRAFETFLKLGPFETARCLLSYLRARAFPIENPISFEDWVTNEFGHRLFQIFFKTYTEKVWGMTCKEISADWAAQRIKGLSLSKTLFHALIPQKGHRRTSTIKTLIDSFRYPRLGPGMMWAAAAAQTKKQGGVIEMGARAKAFRYLGREQIWEVDYDEPSGRTRTVRGRHLISSAPLSELIPRLSPPAASTDASKKLKYREFITVALMLEDKGAFSDNWIYIHDTRVKVGRIQNYKSWSPHMVPDARFVCYGLEYFCFEGDGLWDSLDHDLIELAKRELETIGLAEASQIFDGCVVRQEKAYPVYDHGYQLAIDEIRADLRANYPRLHLVGRNGMHKYNNQDHSMMTAMLTVENIVSDSEKFDVWNVNQDSEYCEETSSTTGLRQIPQPVLT